MNTFRQQAAESLEMIEMEKAKERVDKILGTPSIQHGGFEIHGVEAPTPHQRKPRSDKGVPKAKKEDDRVTITYLNEAQAAHIDKLVTAMRDANIEAHNAAQNAYNACTAYYNYLNELQGKPHAAR